MRIIRTLVVVTTLLAGVSGLSTPVGAQDPPRCQNCGDGGVTEDGSSVFAAVGAGGRVLVTGNGDGCTYWPLDGGSPVDETGEAGGTHH